MNKIKIVFLFLFTLFLLSESNYANQIKLQRLNQEIDTLLRLYEFREANIKAKETFEYVNDSIQTSDSLKTIQLLTLFTTELKLENSTVCDSLLVQLELLESKGLSDELKIEINNCKANFYCYYGEYNRAIELRKHTMEILEQKEDSVSKRELAESTLFLSQIYRVVKMYKESEKVALQAYEQALQLYGPNSPYVIETLKNLIFLYQDVNQYEKATSYMTLYEINVKKNFGENHYEYAFVMQYNAKLLNYQGKYYDATKCYQNAKYILSSTVGEESVHYADLLMYYQEHNRELNKIDYCQSQLNECMEIYQKKLGVDSKKYLNARITKAMYLAKDSYCDSASVELMKVINEIELKKRRVPSVQKSVLRILRNNYYDNYQMEKSSEINQKLLEFPKPLRVDSINYAHDLYCEVLIQRKIGDKLKSKGQYLLAKKCLEKLLFDDFLDNQYQYMSDDLRYLFKYKHKYHMYNSDLYCFYLDLIRFYGMEDKNQEMVLDISQKLLAIKTKMYGENHIETIKVLLKHQESYGYLKEYKKSEKYQVLAYNSSLQLYGITHLKTASILEGLGHVYRNQKKYVKSQGAYEEALAIRKQIVSNNHELIFHNYLFLGTLFQMQGKRLKAEEYFFKAINIAKYLKISNKNNLFNIYTRLAMNSFELNQSELAGKMFAIAIKQKTPEELNKIDPSGYFYAVYGEVLFRMEQRGEGVVYLEKAYSLQLNLYGEGSNGLAYLAHKLYEYYDLKKNIVKAAYYKDQISKIKPLEYDYYNSDAQIIGGLIIGLFQIFYNH